MAIQDGMDSEQLGHVLLHSKSKLVHIRTVNVATLVELVTLRHNTNLCWHRSVANALETVFRPFLETFADLPDSESGPSTFYGAFATQEAFATLSPG